MEVIPVIDLKGGVVVHARMGRRDDYKPIETPLAAGSDPVDVARGLMKLFPFRTLYVADLDAITGTGDNRAALRRLRDAWPRLDLWVDSGIADAAAMAEWRAGGIGTMVIGSETLRETAPLQQAGAQAVLSLDYRGDTFVGPADLLATPQLWPARVIAMTLARVGSGAGPDLARLAAIRAAAPDRAIYAAGGVRDAGDLAALARAGMAGALVASSLHDGRLRGSDIAALAAG